MDAADEALTARGPATPSGDVFALVKAACILEATAVKAGNVHPAARFADTDFEDFQRSATITAACWEAVPDASVGPWIYSAVREVKLAIGRNTNLGIILLLAPLAKAAQMALERTDRWSLPSHEVLAALTPADARDVYAAIALAAPGGLGRAGKHDVSRPSQTGGVPPDLVDAMCLAADRDDIARQYATNFADVYELAGRLATRISTGETLLEAVSRLQVEWLAERPDTLIARKRGPEVAEDIRRRAAEVLAAGGEQVRIAAGADGPAAYDSAWEEFDRHLRSEGNRLNPGTTADLLAAAIFVYLFQTSSD